METINQYIFNSTGRCFIETHALIRTACRHALQGKAEKSMMLQTRLAYYGEGDRNEGKKYRLVYIICRFDSH